MGQSSSSRSAVAAAMALAGTAIFAFGCSAVAGDPSDGGCQYPASGHGYVPGAVPPPTLSWQGWDESRGRSTISIADYLDCDGSRGINALLVDQSTAWCGVCQGLAASVAAHMRESWRGRGIHVLTLITESADRKPATVETALAWKQRFGLEGTAVAADPSLSFRGTAGEQVAPYPYEILIDARTMAIVRVDAGFRGDEDFAPVLDLARANAR